MGGIFVGWSDWINPFIGAILEGVSISLAIFTAPTVGILALNTIWNIGKDV